MSFWGELKRRRVVQVAAVYAVTAWLLVQVIVSVEAPLNLPGWVDTFVILLLAIGFPVALILSWAFDLTPGGIQTTHENAPGQSVVQGAPATTFTYVIQGMVLAAVAFLVADQYLLDDGDRTAADDTDIPNRTPSVTRFYEDVPGSQFFADQTIGQPVLAMSPNGNRLLYVLNDRLYVREMNELEPRLVLENTPNMHTLMPSPDGNAVAYCNRETAEIRRVAVSGGSPITIATGVTQPFGGSWAADDTILFARPDGVYRTSAGGEGAAKRLFEIADGKRAFGPQLLPDGDSVLFSVATRGAWDEGEIVVQSIETGERRVLVAGGTSVRYLPTGHLIYAIDEDLYAVPFDLDTLTVTRQAVRVLEGVMRARAKWHTGVAQYDISQNGTLAYITKEEVRLRNVVWVDREGSETIIPIEPRAYSMPRISPDGMRVVLNEQNLANDIWVWNLRNETPTRLILGPEGGDVPAWSADGSQIAYHPSVGPVADWRAANNAGSPERLATGDDTFNPLHPEDFSPSGQLLVFHYRATGSGFNIGLITIDDRREPRPLLQSATDEHGSDISPNGRWIAYQSNESGRYEVYARPFPNVDDDQIPVSNRGGSGPTWSRDGRKLFYVEPGIPPRLMSVEVDTTQTEFNFGERSPVIDWPYLAENLIRDYDVHPDGRQFLALKPIGNEPDRPRIIVVENWFEELRKLVPGEN